MDDLQLAHNDWLNPDSPRKCSVPEFPDEWLEDRRLDAADWDGAGMIALTGLSWYGWLIVTLAIAAVFFMALAIHSKWRDIDPEIERHA